MENPKENENPKNNNNKSEKKEIDSDEEEESESLSSISNSIHEEDNKPSEAEKEEISKKEMIAEKIIQKWLSLQKIIKEEITLEDVIIHRYKEDFNKLQTFYLDYHNSKLKLRNNKEDMKKLSINDKNQKELVVDREGVGRILVDTYEPIKNLLFIFRNNYDYVIRLVSLIDEKDDQDKVESLVELFCNQFYDNILIPNPEQKELLLLIFLLFKKEILNMNCATLDEFLSDTSFLGKFISTYVRRHEMNIYLSMLLSPIINSIENVDKDCLDLSLSSVQRYVFRKEKGRFKFSNISNMEKKKDLFDYENRLYNKIPKTNIIFKKNYELEMEKEEEENSVNKDLDEIELYSDKDLANMINSTLLKNMGVNKNIINNLLEMKKEEYNKEYKEELNEEKLIELMENTKDENLKEIFLNHLEQIYIDPDMFTNKGLIECLKQYYYDELKNLIIGKFKRNFLYIQKKINFLIQSMIDKISTIPYTIRCICKIIYLLMSQKFPNLPKYYLNSFIGKFFFSKYIFPVLSLENKNIMDNRIFSSNTKKCINVIISVLDHAYKSKFFITQTDTEKTIFNYYLIEIIPILNTFFEKLIDVELPKVVENLFNTTEINPESNIMEKIITKKKEKKDEKKTDDNNENKEENKSENKEENKEEKKEENEDKEDNKNDNKEENKNEQSNNQESNKKEEKDIKNEENEVLFDYFKENPDEILHLESICFSLNDILFILSLIGKNIEIFSDLPKYNFFCKTYKHIKSKDYKIDAEIDKEPKRTKFFVLFKDEKIPQLEKLVGKKKKEESSFLTENQNLDLICKRVKFSIKTVLKGLNLLNNKDFSYLSTAISNEKFFSSLQYTLDDLEDFSDMLNQIPLKWYGQYLTNNKKRINQKYQNNDFEELYKEMFEEENKILEELKSFSRILITRDGMNLGCGEKILEQMNIGLSHIEQAKKIVKIEKFINSEIIEVCIQTIKENEEKNTINNTSNNVNNDYTNILIIDAKECPHSKSSFSNLLGLKKKTHCLYIRDMIKFFVNGNWFEDNNIIESEEIKNQNRNKLIYKAITSYMRFVMEKVKKPIINKGLFGPGNDEDLIEIKKKIEDYILKKIYKFVYPKKPIGFDDKFYNTTRCLDWVTPEQLGIKKEYVNQLGFAELCIKKMEEAISVTDKLECISNALDTVICTVKFSREENTLIGNDELGTIFMYILIRAQPRRINSNINYIKCFAEDDVIKEKKEKLFSLMDNATINVLKINHLYLKITREEFKKNFEEAKARHNIDEI